MTDSTAASEHTQTAETSRTVGARVTGLRRWLPRGVRLRLTLLYTVLFLAGGAALLGISYALVSDSLNSGTNGVSVRAVPSEAFIAQCKAQQQGQHPAGAPGKGTEKSVSLACEKAFQEGAIAEQQAQRAHTMHELLAWSLVGLAGLSVVSAGLGWWMAGRVLRPVHDITEAARRASERHLGERINMGGPEDELKELADTFDAMLERLDLAFAVQRQFVANASHELRTPLTSMRTAIDVVLAKPNPSTEQMTATVEKARRSIERAEHIIDALLTLAVSNQGTGEVEPLDLATATEDALDAVDAGARAAGLQVDAELSAAEVTGSRVLLERLVGNLVENAVVHNVPDGWVRVRSGAHNGHAYLEVANSGPVVKEEELGDLFEPFRRADGRIGSSGVGLGLSIVRSVSEAHGAQLKTVASAAGGLIVTVTMPSRATGISS
jgi:signal transduction histidine kinase